MCQSDDYIAFVFSFWIAICNAHQISRWIYIASRTVYPLVMKITQIGDGADASVLTKL